MAVVLAMCLFSGCASNYIRFSCPDGTKLKADVVRFESNNSVMVYIECNEEE